MELSNVNYASFRERTVRGRYVTHAQISKFLEEVFHLDAIDQLGHSVQGRPINALSLGSGTKKVLMWSQMHGNESTTTKAVLDFINFLGSDAREAKKLLAACTFRIIPMLNPDGAEVYTRVNANQVDLNRDAQDLSQPESRILKKAYLDFRPDFCFNLHDQRTLFNVGTTAKPATISFLAPASDTDRTVTPSRKKSMQLIAAIHRAMQPLIPGQVGRYDDTFNANCVGDAFQLLGTPTLLFEAGHFEKDYEREKTRQLVFQSMYAAISAISTGGFEAFGTKAYFAIPENNKLFFDVLVHNVGHLDPSRDTAHSLGIRYKEVLKNGRIHFVPEVDRVGNLSGYYGHATYDCRREKEIKALQEQSFWGDLQKWVFS